MLLLLLFLLFGSVDNLVCSLPIPSSLKSPTRSFRVDDHLPTVIMIGNPLYYFQAYIYVRLSGWSLAVRM